MKKLVLAAASAIVLASAASAANAAVTVMAAVEGDLTGTTLASYGMVMLDDFDGIDDARTSYLGNIIEYPDEFEDPIVTSAPPPGDLTNYASVQGGSSATYALLGGNSLRSFSFYLGSPDMYNRVIFNFVGGGSQTLSGNQIWDGPDFGGDRSKGFRVYYNFGGAKVSSITFESDQNAFEFDGLAGSVPEPSTWAMMIMGFGAAGAMFRSRRRTAVA